LEQDQIPGLEGLILSEDSSHWPRKLGSGATIVYRVRDLRWERTGVHGMVAIILNKDILAYNTFNVTRDEDRGKLVRSAQKLMNAVIKSEYDEATMKAELDLLLLWLVTNWHRTRFQVTEFDHAVNPGKFSFPIYPYLIEFGGTIAFSAPGSGKSYLTQAMALTCTTGTQHLWKIDRTRPALYINLERAKEGLEIRESKLRTLMGIKGPGRVSYIHARGHGLRAIAPSAKEWAKKNPSGVVFLDSVSRTQLGKLTDDDTANSFIDSMNFIGLTWWGIGHTPRDNGDHVFGSQHFDAGQDIGIKLTSQRQGDTVGVSFQVTKSNDTGRPPPAFYAMDFHADGMTGLVGIRKSSSEEFPSMTNAADTPKSMISRAMKDDKEHGGRLWQKELERITSLHAEIVRHALNDTAVFQSVGAEGGKKLFSLVS
jgi:hypothetical protein